MLGMMAHALIPALERQRQINLCELPASLVYIKISMRVRDMKRDPVSKRQNKSE